MKIQLFYLIKGGSRHCSAARCQSAAHSLRYTARDNMKNPFSYHANDHVGTAASFSNISSSRLSPSSEVWRRSCPHICQQIFSHTTGPNIIIFYMHIMTVCSRPFLDGGNSQMSLSSYYVFKHVKYYHFFPQM